LFDENILAGCQRFEPDEDHMRELWNHELDANAKEATLAVGIISRYVRDNFFLFTLMVSTKILCSDYEFQM
jgi:hypothetical protein